MTAPNVSKPEINSATTIFLQASLRDPVVARDGRPFNAGMRMKSLSWPYPSVLAGVVRTMLGGLNGGDFAGQVDRLKQIEVAGPFPLLTDGAKPQVCLPAPNDLVVRKNPDTELLESFAMRPQAVATGAGCDFLPKYQLQPVVLPDTIAEEFKPLPTPEFWTLPWIVKWLSGQCENFFGNASSKWPEGFFKSPRKDPRTHVKMDNRLGAGVEGMLFQTTGLDAHWLPKPDSDSLDGCRECEWALRIRTSDSDYLKIGDTLNMDQSVGGERRLAHWKNASTHATRLWEFPPAIEAAVADVGKQFSGVRMTLATPALFENGWHPAWIRETGHFLEGAPPQANAQIRLRLIGASVSRWLPISGWSFETHGAKPVRRLASTGSTWFFEVLNGEPATLTTALKKLWLEPVSDNPQDCRDGFGLGMWGVW